MQEEGGEATRTSAFVIEEVSSSVKEAMESPSGGGAARHPQGIVDHLHSTINFLPTHQAGKAIPMHCDLCNQEQNWATQGQFLLLGQLY